MLVDARGWSTKENAASGGLWPRGIPRQVFLEGVSWASEEQELES